jgi:FtsZ-binding cell division protein ZapB
MTEDNTVNRLNQIIALVILIVIAAVSFFYVSKLVTKPEFNASTIESLDEKKETVMRLTLAAAASSTALTLIPGDAAMPVANEIAKLSSYFIIILSAILLEKMLIAVVGHVVFIYIIPFACFFGILYLYTKKEILLSVAIKLSIFGIVLFLAIPASIQISNLIDESYQFSLNQALETVEQNKEYIEEKNNELSEEEKNWMGKIGDYVSKVTSDIGNRLSDMVSKGEDTLAAFLDAISILIITSCVIPIVIILIFIGIIKILFSFEINDISTLFKKNE